MDIIIVKVMEANMNKPKGLGTPQLGARGVRCGLMGQPGTGKTEFVFGSIPKLARLYVVDTEGRSQYYDPDKHHGFEVLESKVPSDALELLRYVEHLYRQGEKVVFAIDSTTPIWHHQQEVAEDIGKTSFGTARFNSWGPAKKPIKELYKALYASPLDVVLTMRSKAKYVQDAQKKVKDMGYDVADMEKNLPYVLDLLLELGTEQKNPGVALTPEDFFAVVRKTSGPKDNNPLPIGRKLTNPSFGDIVAMRLEGELERFHVGGDVALQVALATVRNGAAFWAWAQDFTGMPEETLRPILTEQVGELKGSKLKQTIQYVFENYKEAK